jgi:hypothetical protein
MAAKSAKAMIANLVAKKTAVALKISQILQITTKKP